MHDVAREFACAVVRSKDAQKQSAVRKKMATRAEAWVTTSSPGPSPRRFSKWRILKIVEEKALGTRLAWVNRPNRFEVMSTNMAAGREGKRIAPNENDIYGAKLIKEINLLTKTEAIRC